MLLGVGACFDIPDPPELSAGGGGSSASGNGGMGGQGGSVGPGGGGGSDCMVVHDGACLQLVELVTGGAFTYAIMSDGSLYCWGKNAYGECGVEPAPEGALAVDHVSTPTRVEGVSGVTAAVAGKHHGCALTDAGVMCWGNNDVGQLGLGPEALTSAGALGTPPVALPWRPPTLVDITDVVELYAGTRTTCVRRVDDSLWCWGFRQNGQGWNGDFTGTHDPAPVPMTAFDGLDIAGMGMAMGFSCLRLADHTVRCAGHNLGGGLGTGDDVTSLAPVEPLLGEPITMLGPGPDHMCARTEAGTALCWGTWSEDPQSPYFTPVDKSSDHPSPVKSVCTGWLHGCALHEDGKVTCWGQNTAGQAGSGNGLVQPQLLGGVPSLESLACGWEHNCGIDAAGEVWCWGSNWRGELGQGVVSSGKQASAVQVLWP